MMVLGIEPTERYNVPKTPYNNEKHSFPTGL